MSKITVCLTTAFFLLCMVWAPLTSRATAEAVQLVLTTALPALFPFFFGAALLTTTGSIAQLGRAFAPLFARMYRLPAAAAGVFLLSITGGYPVGVQATATLYRDGQLTRPQAVHLLTFANNTGPAFLVSLCGGALLHSTGWGLVLYAVHVGTALLVGVLLRDRHAHPPAPTAPPCTQTPALLSCFLRSVQQAGITSLRVSAFILIFAILREILQAIGAFSVLATLLTPLCLGLGGQAHDTPALVAGMLELTYGLQQLPTGVVEAVVPLMSFLVAFGGLSVWAQSLSLLAETDLPATRLLCGKCLHAVLAGGMMRVVLWLWC